MHILLIHQAFAALDEPGGTRHHELARHLRRQGHEVTIIASPISYLTGADQGHAVRRQVDDLGVTIIRSYTLPVFHRSFFWRVISFFSFMISSFINGLFVKQVDLVWGTTPPIFQGPTAWLLARLKGKPFLLEVRAVPAKVSSPVEMPHMPLYDEQVSALSQIMPTSSQMSLSSLQVSALQGSPE